MVDQINGLGQVQGITSTNKNQNTQGKRSEETERSQPRDEVSISEEALNLSQAKKTAADARAQIFRDDSVTLGLDPNFDTSI